MDRPTPGGASPYAPMSLTPDRSSPYKPPPEAGTFCGRHVQPGGDLPGLRRQARPLADAIPGTLAPVGGPGGPPLWATAAREEPRAAIAEPLAVAPASAQPAPASTGVPSLAPGGPPREAPERAEAPARDKRSRSAVRREARQRAAERAKLQEAARQQEAPLDRKQTGSARVPAAVKTGNAGAGGYALGKPTQSPIANATVAAMMAASSMPSAWLHSQRGTDHVTQAGAAVLPAGQLEGDLNALFLACDSNYALFQAVSMLEMLKADEMAQLFGPSAPLMFAKLLRPLIPLPESLLDKYFERVFALPATFPRTAGTMERSELLKEIAQIRMQAGTADAKSGSKPRMYRRCIASVDRVLLKAPLQPDRLTAAMPLLSLVLQAARSL